MNEGSNLGPLVYTLSGTLGAAYVAVGRGIPAIAVSGQNSTKVNYDAWNPEDPTEVGESSYSDLCETDHEADARPCFAEACSQRSREIDGGPRFGAGLRT